MKLSTTTEIHSRAASVVKKLQQAGFETYFAGGYVRDMLLNRVSHDIDIATAAPPEKVQALFSTATDLQGKSFGVIRVRGGESIFEVTTFRKDGEYTDGRRPNSITFGSAQEDAQRRDFTINGLFYNPTNQEIIDFVNGQDDLSKKNIRAIGDPRKRFEEDHLRLYRAIRFAAQLDFNIDPSTWTSLVSMASLGSKLAPERVRDELTKSFCSAHTGKAFDLLTDSGLIDPWIPEINLMRGVEQPPQFHPEGDVFIHVRMMMHQLTFPSTILAWSVLLHDIGKPATMKVDETGRIRFNEHESVGASMSERILRRLRFSNDESDAICSFVANHMSFKDVPHMRLSTLKRFLSRPLIDEEMELHRIDCLCSHKDLSIYQQVKERKESLSNEELAPPPLVTGNDLIAFGMKSGKDLGRALAMIRDRQLEGSFKSREDALHYAQAVVKQFCPT